MCYSREEAGIIASWIAACIGLFILGILLGASMSMYRQLQYMEEGKLVFIEEPIVDIAGAGANP